MFLKNKLLKKSKPPYTKGKNKKNLFFLTEIYQLNKP